jgi:addiction module RelE/StbE family toxin
MKVRFHKKFAKDYARLGLKVQRAFESRLQIFCANPYQAELSNHPLKGKWRGYRSINISGDFRAVYKEITEEEAIFITIGSHSQLYR